MSDFIFVTLVYYFVNMPLAKDDFGLWHSHEIARISFFPFTKKLLSAVFETGV
jgi:hypothetical protein